MPTCTGRGHLSPAREPSESPGDGHTAALRTGREKSMRYRCGGAEGRAQQSVNGSEPTFLSLCLIFTVLCSSEYPSFLAASVSFSSMFFKMLLFFLSVTSLSFFIKNNLEKKQKLLLYCWPLFIHRSQGVETKMSVPCSPLQVLAGRVKE